MEKKKTRSVIPIGPYHPLQEEPEFFRLHVEGETVKELEIHLGYNHRGIEKLSEGKHFDQAVFLVERICGICSTSHPFAFANAVENLAGVSIPERALYIRSIVGELERIHSHLLWLGLAGHFIGYNTVWMWSWKYRELVLDIFEMISGNRNHYAMITIGGVNRDITPEQMPFIIDKMDELKKVLDMFRGVVMDDPILHLRTKGVGVLPLSKAKDYAVLGPTARASGWDIDVRHDDPYAAYPLVEWNTAVEKEGDVFAKIMVRIREMYESIKIVEQCLDKLRCAAGPIDMHLKDVPQGDGIGRHEAPRGECFHYVRSDGSNHPVRHKIRAPSYMNIASNCYACAGATISDAALILAAVDPCYCCTERISAVEKDTDRQWTYKDLVRISQEKTRRLKQRYGLP